jgi:hypothetical protein
MIYQRVALSPLVLSKSGAVDSEPRASVQRISNKTSRLRRRQFARLGRDWAQPMM